MVFAFNWDPHREPLLGRSYPYTSNIGTYGSGAAGYGNTRVPCTFGKGEVKKNKAMTPTFPPDWQADNQQKLPL